MVYEKIISKVSLSFYTSFDSNLFYDYQST
jgi:hypothetical protein